MHHLVSYLRLGYQRANCFGIHRYLFLENIRAMDRVQILFAL